ncbi:TIGR02594 family protein [Bradyrhizobium sp. WSM 1738]|nr:TIGR02594 family protein [Bradyrhizobium hereditatis]
MDSPQPAPTGQPGQFVQARKIAAKTILYVDAQGRQLAKEGGSRSWRNNNPGNIRKGNFATISGAIGDDGAFAIFPEYKLGFDAIVTLLRSNAYVNLTLKDAVFRYAPPNENDSDQYLAFLVRQTGISGATVLSTLAVADIRKIAKFVQIVEGWQVGIERSDEPPSSSNAGAPISSAAGAAMEWMDIAKREAALPMRERSQWADPGENPRILEYFRVACAWFDPAGGDEVDWCAAFVNYCLATAGYAGTDHPGARSFFWNKKNQFVRLEQPRYGAIAVRRYEPFSDPNWATGEGHVGFVHTWTTGSVELLGGNQSNAVKLETYPLVRKNASGKITAQFVAFMMPVMN